MEGEFLHNRNEPPIVTHYSFHITAFPKMFWNRKDPSPIKAAREIKHETIGHRWSRVYRQ